MYYKYFFSPQNLIDLMFIYSCEVLYSVMETTLKEVVFPMCAVQYIRKTGVVTFIKLPGRI